MAKKKITKENSNPTVNWEKKDVFRKARSLDFVSYNGGKNADIEVPIPISARSEAKRSNESRAEKYPTSSYDRLRTYITVKIKAKIADKKFPPKTK